ncbi:MAG: PHP domain-containing protein, partial [Cyanobacteria bacterium]|nr:PHP domain-containing protein [Cyanobacteriota bacterium]
MDKYQIVQALQETGLLLKVKGENLFKAKAYTTAARSIQRTQEDIGVLVAEQRLTDLPGIGKSLAQYVTELYTTGESGLLKKLRGELPAGTAELSQIDRLTLKRIERLSSELNISSLAELEEACETGKVALVKGFGVKLQNDILQSIKGLSSHKDQIRLIKALEIADELIEFLKDELETEKVAIAGSVRRWHEAVEKITVVAESDKSVIAYALGKFSMSLSVEESEELVIAHLLDGVLVELFAVSDLSLGLVAHTGTSEHFEQLRNEASERGITLSATEMKKGRARVKVQDESDVFEALGLNFIPPELREGRDEVIRARSEDFSDLVKIEDIRGMTHCHSTFSDGVHTIEQMALAAQRMGMDYITITDHSPTAHYAGGLDADRLKEQWEEIDRVQEKVKIRILKGTECDILSDGRLDYPDAILEKFDIIVASIHSRYRQNEEQMTKRLLTGLKNPFFKVWGHPLGRLVLSRDPIPCDVEKILEAIADARVAIEINGDPFRLDLAPNWANIAR